MATDIVGVPHFSVGTVISTSLSALFSNILTFLLIMVVIGLPVGLLIGVGVAAMFMTGGGVETGTGMKLNLAAGNTVQILFVVFAAFLGLLAYFLIQASITYGTLQSLRGRKATIAACISNGLAALPRVLLASIVLFIAMAIGGFATMFIWGLLAGAGGVVLGVVGALALVAAFFYVVVLLWVFVPAIVVERAGALECFGRSLELTKGRRWAIFGILVLVFVANWVISFVSQMIGQVGGGAVSGVIDIASGLFFTALGSILAAVGYYCLRAEKEGVQIDDVVKVFD